MMFKSQVQVVNRFPLPVAGLIKEESKPMPPPSTLPKPAAPEATGGHDDQGGTSPKPPAKPVTADTAQRVRSQSS